MDVSQHQFPDANAEFMMLSKATFALVGNFFSIIGWIPSMSKLLAELFCDLGPRDAKGADYPQLRIKLTKGGDKVRLNAAWMV